MVETKKDNYVEGFPLKSQEVKDAKNKVFEILEEPVYEVFEDQETGKVKRRMNILISFNGTNLSYYPNKTSQIIIIKDKGRKLSDWIGFKGLLKTTLQRVGNKELDVIYIE
jgi:hypothetical protein